MPALLSFLVLGISSLFKKVKLWQNSFRGTEVWGLAQQSNTSQLTLYLKVVYIYMNIMIKQSKEIQAEDGRVCEVVEYILKFNNELIDEPLQVTN